MTTTTNNPKPVVPTTNSDTEIFMADKANRDYKHFLQTHYKPADRSKKKNTRYRPQGRVCVRGYINAGRGRMRKPIPVEDEMKGELEGFPVEVDLEFQDDMVAPSRHVSLADFVVEGKKRKDCVGEFEIVPRIRHVLTIDEEVAFYEQLFEDDIEAEEWEWLDRKENSVPTLTYAEVVGQVK